MKNPDDMKYSSDDFNLEKVTESFVWYSFSNISDFDMETNLEEFRELFKESLMENEMKWIDDKKVLNETKIKYKKQVKKDIDEKSKKKMKQIQKTLKDMKLDKESWKKMLKIRSIDGDKK
jgi:hypothetical protein